MQKGLHVLHFALILFLAYFAFVGIDHKLYNYYMAKAVEDVSQ